MPPLPPATGGGEPEGARVGAPGAADAQEASAEPQAVPLDFETLYADHFDFVCRSLRLLGVPPEGLEDAAQDVFGVVSRRLAEFVQKASVKTWLFAIVQRTAANQRRSQRRKRDLLEPLSEPIAAPGASPEAHAEAAQAAVLVQTFADGLDEGHRAVLALALIESVPARDVAEALGIPLYTVYSRVRSVREALRSFLAAQEVET